MQHFPSRNIADPSRCTTREGALDVGVGRECRRAPLKPSPGEGAQKSAKNATRRSGNKRIVTYGLPDLKHCEGKKSTRRFLAQLNPRRSAPRPPAHRRRPSGGSDARGLGASPGAGGPTEARQAAQGPTEARQVAQGPTEARQVAQGPTEARQAAQGPTEARQVAQGPTEARQAAQGPTEARQAAQGPTEARRLGRVCGATR
ncbi:protein piccolo-like [Penaeus vannamei]|uniref:protein piccolo-like n=1 Tax=Penaeus vannamei TaxID=6689 RepID=UPI00387F41BA